MQPLLRWLYFILSIFTGVYIILNNVFIATILAAIQKVFFDNTSF